MISSIKCIPATGMTVRCLLVFGLFCVGAIQAHSAEEWTIDTAVNSYSDHAAEKTDAGKQYWFVPKDALDGRTLKMSIVEPGKATHAPHRHPEDEFFFVLEGTAEFFLNGERREVGAYTSLYCPPDSLHGIRNAGDTVLKYLVIKKYQND